MKWSKSIGILVFPLCLGLLGMAGCYNLVGTTQSGNSGQTISPGSGAVRYFIAVSRHESVAITETDVDEALAYATAIAQNNDGAGDTACNIVLARKPQDTVVKFTNATTPKRIETQADFEAVLTEPGQVKVVDEIYWCGGFEPTGFSGCARTGDDSIVVIALDRPAYNGDLWLHEFAHVQNVAYHSDDPNMVMYGRIALPFVGNMLTREECYALKG